MDARTRRFRTALDILGATRAQHILGALTRGLGLVFTLHRVRPAVNAAFAPNQLLEITPDFLAVVLEYLREIKYDLVTLDEAVERVKTGHNRGFAAFTFDESYRDVRDNALPLMRRYNAPAMMFVTTEFADGVGDLWWIVLENAIAKAHFLEFRGEAIDTSTTEKKCAAWDQLYWQLRAMDEFEMRDVINGLARAAGADVPDLPARLNLNWDELRALAPDPLISFGNHTVGHYMLGKLTADMARSEVVDAQTRIARELGVVPKHVAYPVGDPSSAGQREFEVSRELGLAGWTTRLGVLFPEHRDHLPSLPRVSLNGHYQQRKYAEMFISGLPFAINNRFRRLNVSSHRA